MRNKALQILSILLFIAGTVTTARAQGVSFPEGADQPKSKIKILGNVYGGGDQAPVEGNTTVEISKGQYAGDIFGGGNGALYTAEDEAANPVHKEGLVKASADIGTHNDDGSLVENTGSTSVTIKGGEIIFDDEHPSNHNIYGGGNLACNVAGSTDVQMKTSMVTWYSFLSNQEAAIPAWYQWYDQAMNPNTQKTPIVAVFGAGYGAHTDVAGNTHVDINIQGTNEIKPANGTSFTHDELEEIDKIIMRWMPDHRLVGQFVSAVHGGGYDGTVGAYDATTYASDPSTGGINYDKTTYASQTNITIQGQPFIFNVYGGGLGSKAGADANGNVNSHVGAVYGGTKVDVQGGIINGDVFGGGAGIAGDKDIPNPIGSTPPTIKFPYTFAAQVYRETDVTVSGNSTVIFGNVYGGGDIANTGWYADNARPIFDGHQEQVNMSLGKLDYTTSLKLNGGNILGKVFGGGNGRTKQDIEQYKFIGSVIGSTNVNVNGSHIWNTIYGGGNTGCVYDCKTIATTQGNTGRTMVTGVIDGCTNLAILDGMVAQDIFGGGFGANPTQWEDDISSADVYGNTFVYFKKADLEFEKYWKPRKPIDPLNPTDPENPQGTWGVDEFTGKFLAQRSDYDEVNDVDHRNTESDVTHNLYGGGNVACDVKGNTHVYMQGAPTAPANFNTTQYYRDCIANVAKPHFSAFGGGFGVFAKVTGNAYSDINLGYGTGLHSIIGGGMNGPVDGSCQVHVGNDPMSLVHHVYGGGYYAPCKSTELEITRGTILENVFGGSVMGTINGEGSATAIATRTVIGLQTPGTNGDGTLRHSSIDLEDEKGTILRSYAYADHKNQITIGGNVYGANDVSGTVNGIASLTIYGGTVKGDVFGAGNGDHIGYYEPNTLRYDLGAHGIANYFYVDHHGAPGTAGNTYVGRPQTIGGVELTLEGNTKEERVSVLGQVFGGGNSCTVGAWDKDLLASYGSNPHLTRDDPAYFLGGGKIDMNLGSHVTVGRNHAQLAAAADGSKYLIGNENVSGLYMGCSGRNLATQDWSKTNNYYHHYFDANTGRYWPGFAVYEDDGATPLNRAGGLKSFRAYMSNILVWTNDVCLNIPDDVDDLWLANFVGGGFRGSMKAKDENGQFHYTLPRGLTIGHNVIGGAYNTDVVYRIFETTDGHNYTEENGHYKYLTDKGGLKSYEEDNENGDYHHIEYAADGTTITGIARFYYNGGMLSELPYETDPSLNDRIDRIQKKYVVHALSPSNKDFTGTGLGDAAAYTTYKKDALVFLDLNNKFETEYLDGHVHGGNVFGGCFESGRVEGDIWTDYRCYQEGEQARAEDFNLSDKNFAQAKDFENNFSMMLFGAGYGKNTTIQGSAYVRVLHQEANPGSPIPGAAIGYPRLYNVFGGSYEGRVEGNTNVYFNPGKYGYVTGAIYGGGCNGYVGGRTYLELAGGYIDEAYGGARNANVGGGTHIWTYDGSARWWGEDVVHADGRAFVESDAEKAPLFIGKLYGGTDISGKICTNDKDVYTKENGYQPYYTAEYWPKELTSDGVYNASDISNQTYIDTYLQVGGIHQSNHGYPIIGAVYAAGNGEKTEEFFGSDYTAAKLPDQHSTLMEVSDGNIVYAFGGGNRATVTDQNYILVRSYLDSKHEIEGLGGQMYNVMKKRILSVGVDCYDEKLVDGQNVLDLKNASIQRLFGGNNIATMAIQPKWNLFSGRINNVYSGGNMGDMTYYNVSGKPATEDGTETGKSGSIATDGSNSNYEPRGLSITIEHPEIHIVSLYGGCRLSDVIPGGYSKDSDGNYLLDTNGDRIPAQKAEFDKCEDYYGATVNITDGYIENVYGGNDISGTVHFGTNVNLSGAVSGNVYGSGNGFYLYKWDTEDREITEHLLRDYDSEAPEKDLCYTVPVPTGLNDTQKLLAINAARPSVEKAFLNIAGLENYTDPETGTTAKRVAYVKGNVFCGGNASTILGTESFSKFKIGSYVTLNGVFMGSDGYAFTQQDEIARFAKYNQFTDMGAETVPDAFPDWDGSRSDDASHNPILLNVYMMAVDMKAQPKDFNLNLPLKEAHIGTYCGGGNRGSMLVDKTVSLPFHHDIIIYDKIVGACLDANVNYNQNGTIIKSEGGYTRKITDNATYGNTKMNLEISSQFVPMVMDVPADKLPTTKNSHGETFVQAAAHDFLYSNQTEGVKYTYQEYNDLFETHYDSQTAFESGEGANNIWKEARGLYAPSCNIYGGCYQSGEVEGDIILNLHSNMLRYVNQDNLDKSLANNIACFNVYGAGFGQDSHVWGDVHIIMDRSLNPSTMGEQIAESTLSTELKGKFTDFGAFDIWDGQLNNDLSGSHAVNRSYPSFNNVFGGGRNGKLIGNATVEIRNGLVYSDVAGGCYASDMYGSTAVIVGYPKYWECKESGEYAVQRGDQWNTDKEDFYGDKVVKQSVMYLKGDLVPNNVYEQIVAANSGNASKFDEVEILPVNGKNTPTHTLEGSYDGTTWDDIHIKIGKGVYGGGYSLANSTAASAGSITTHKLDDKPTADLHPHNFDGRYGVENTLATTVGYGGNSNIMVGDEASNAATRDHIHISTLKEAVANIPATSTVIGKFIKETVDGKEVYTHQGDHAPLGGVTYYTLSGDGGLYGDGHLTFCEGFRAADVTRYGYADGTAKHPVLLNTFQRMDLISINDCCLMLQGAQDFATDQIDATMYSITRVNELRLNSSLPTTDKLGEISQQTTVGGEGADFGKKRQRNYMAFFNNVHYLGSIVTNDDFGDSQHHFHDKSGALDNTITYKAKKQEFITAYETSPLVDGKKTVSATEDFKQRNVATARNAIGINNGYCLRIQNQEYVGSGTSKQSQTYYGPIVGVCEVKLLTLVQGEGGGYVYADNIHEAYNGKSEDEHFLMTSGNFVFPGIVNDNPEIGNQYIVDDCFLEHYGTPADLTVKQRGTGQPLDEAHYWYVEGNKYFFTTTLTGFTYKDALNFNLTKTDPNIILSGLENGSLLNVKKIEWLSTETGFHRPDYEAVLPTTDKEEDKDTHTLIDKISDYEFDVEIGGYGTDDWKWDMPRYSDLSGTTGKKFLSDKMPQFNIKLQDKLDNSGDAKYENHLDEPELVKIYLEGDNNGQKYEYTITVNIVYLQGPTVTGGVRIDNCALPGELIRFSTDGLKVKTPELMPITAASWKILPLKQIDEHGVWEWDMDNAIVIPDSRYSENLDGDVEGTIRALYKQNEYNIAYIFTAGGYDFPVMPAQTIPYATVGEYNVAKGTALTADEFNSLPEADKVKAVPEKENRMIVVHNYHRMKDVVPQDLQIESMPADIPDKLTHANKPALAEAKLYIEDEADLRAFVNYLNSATAGNADNIPEGLTGLDVILQRDIVLTQALPSISQSFDGNFHGDGHNISLGTFTPSLFGSHLTGKVYNLGLIGGTISSADAKAADGLVNGTHTFNSYEYAESDDFKYGRNAYRLSHYFTPATEGGSAIVDAGGNADPALGYVYNRYANGDYQYATTNRPWSLRTGAPNYNLLDTHHNMGHTHDAARWDGTAGVNVPLYSGTQVVEDKKVVVDIDIFTYPGLPEGYANDYLFFGQHLDKAAADAYPVPVNPVATGDADKAKGGNRVYETSGYYHSPSDQKFYYNKDAWALQPSLTAIDFSDVDAAATPADLSGRTTEGDGADNKPTAFHKASSHDHLAAAAITDNLLVYTWLPNDAATNPFAEGIYADDQPEADVVYHTIGSDGKIANFHLVDKQCFLAPVAFDVTHRAWYDRQPQGFRNIGQPRWEGIVLPFSPSRALASTNGEISHFYGHSDQHHEYWLRGLTSLAAAPSADGSLDATFARPGTAADGHFAPASQEHATELSPYVYRNEYFAQLLDYNADPEYGVYYALAADAGQPMNDYIYLTRETPYIVAFPGNDYYEFSMEGDEMYNVHADLSDAETHRKTGDPQSVTFEALGTTHVPVSATAMHTLGLHHGTFLTLNGPCTPQADGAILINTEAGQPGNAFEVTDQPVLPFRTYWLAAASPAPPQTRSVRIVDGGMEGAEPEPDIDREAGLTFTVDHLAVTVCNGYDEDKLITVHLPAGELVMRHMAPHGRSTFRLPKNGLYIINGQKILTR